MDIKLNLINESNDTNNSQVVIFQKNQAANSEELVVAWKVIQNMGKGDFHPFNYALETQISASDSFGNFLPAAGARNGQLFRVMLSSSGQVLGEAGAASAGAQIQLRNDLQAGAVNAHLYRGGKLLATKTSVSPRQMAAFAFKSAIWIGVVAQVEEGQVMNSAIISTVNTELSLLGISAADIVLTGGGSGPGATPYVFTLTHVAMKAPADGAVALPSVPGEAPAVLKAQSQTVELSWQASPDFRFDFTLVYDQGGYLVAIRCRMSSTRVDAQGDNYLPWSLSTRTAGQQDVNIEMQMAPTSGAYDGAVWCDIRVPGFVFQGAAFLFSATISGPAPETVW